MRQSEGDATLLEKGDATLLERKKGEENLEKGKKGKREKG
jgi:hypothetical protein